MSDVAFLDRSAPKAARIFERDPHDWYVEEIKASTGLLRVERFVGPVWDPACGGGNILRACTAAGLQATGTDIVRRMPEDDPFFVREFDFLGAQGSAVGTPPHLPFPEWYATNIVTNPPFFRAKGTEAFIRKALTIARGKVAIFADVKFLASQRRATGLFAEHCPHRVWTLAERPSCPPGAWLAAGNKAGGGTADWCWLVYDLTAPPARTYQGGWILPEEKCA